MNPACGPLALLSSAAAPDLQVCPRAAEIFMSESGLAVAWGEEIKKMSKDNAMSILSPNKNLCFGSKGDAERSRRWKREKDNRELTGIQSAASGVVLLRLMSCFVPCWLPRIGAVRLILLKTVHSFVKSLQPLMKRCRDEL